MFTKTQLDAFVDQWFVASFAHGAVASNTEAYNQASESRNVLKADLAKLMGIAAPTPAIINEEEN